MPRNGARAVTRVLIVSDIRLYREGLARLFDADESIQLGGVCVSITDALLAAADDSLDVVLLDMTTPGALDGIRLLSTVSAGPKVVALGVFKRDEDVIACAEAGVAGYVFRDASIEEVRDTIQSAAAGKLHCSPELAAMLLQRVAGLAASIGPLEKLPYLTRREREVVALIDEGLSNKEIAARLFIEVPTVKNHIHNLLEKLGVHSRIEAAAKLRRQQSPARIHDVSSSATESSHRSPAPAPHWLSRDPNQRRRSP